MRIGHKSLLNFQGGSTERGSATLLTNERKKLENAMEVATLKGSSSVEIDGKKVTVIDDGSGRMVKPAQSSTDSTQKASS